MWLRSAHHELCVCAHAGGRAGGRVLAGQGDQAAVRDGFSEGEMEGSKQARRISCMFGFRLRALPPPSPGLGPHVWLQAACPAPPLPRPWAACLASGCMPCPQALGRMFGFRLHALPPPSPGLGPHVWLQAACPAPPLPRPWAACLALLWIRSVRWTPCCLWALSPGCWRTTRALPQTTSGGGGGSSGERL